MLITITLIFEIARKMLILLTSRWNSVREAVATVQTKSARHKKPAYHHGDLHAALIAAALFLIDQHGVKGFTLKDAAVIAGVSTAAPYRHFADKEALLRAIEDEGFRLFNASLASAYERGQTPSSKIEELGVAYVLFALEHPAHFRVMFGMRGGHSDSPPPMDDNAHGFLLLVAAVAALHPNATPEYRNDLVIASWSIVHGFAMLYIEEAFSVLGDIGAVEDQLRRVLKLTISSSIGR
jgi:AcrR family transcriptional regulator